MEKINKRELSVAELEGQRIELLPDRVEMRRKRRVINQQQATSNTLALQQNNGVFIIANVDLL